MGVTVNYALLIGLIAVIYAAYLAFRILREDRGTEKIIQISDYIKEGADAYLKKQYRVIMSIAAIIAVILLLTLGYKIAIAYIIGAIASMLSGFIGMYIAVNSNSRTANAARVSGLNKALSIAFSGGSVLGFMVVGLGLIGLTGLYVLYGDGLDAVYSIIGFSFGASTVALFARVGGGIYTKAADIGADLVGKVEAKIPEDDPRNPGVIADNVGDNVGDCAGMGADLFESYVGSIVSAMVLGAALFRSIEWIVLPLLIASVGIIASMIASIMVRVSKSEEPSKPLTFSTFLSAILTAAFSIPISIGIVGFDLGIKVIIAIISGIVSGVIIGATSDYFTNRDKAPVRKVAVMSQMGPALTILTGLSMGFYSVVIPAIAIALAGLISVSYTHLTLPTN